MSMTSKVVIFFCFVVLLIGCSLDNNMQQYPAQNITETEIPENFDWNFTDNVEVNITAVDSQGNPVSDCFVSLYKNDDDMVFGLPTNASGKLITSISMPESAQFVTLVYGDKSEQVAVVDNLIEHEIVVENTRSNRTECAIFYPSEDNVCTAMFEDLWPLKGDYDFNDMFVEVSGKLLYDDSDSFIDYIEIAATLVACGANRYNGFAIEYSTTAFPSTLVDNIEYSMYDYNGNQMVYTSQYIENTFGTELTWDEANGKMKFNFFNDSFTILTKSNVGIGANTDELDAWQNPVTIKIRIDYVHDYVYNPTTPCFDLVSPNPFITVSGNPGCEIHLPGMPYTNAFNQFDYFGEHDDITPGTGIADPTYGDVAYTTSEGYSWAMLLEGRLEYPKEKIDIVDAYPELGLYFSDPSTYVGNWWQPHPDPTYADGKIYDREDLTVAQQNE